MSLGWKCSTLPFTETEGSLFETQTSVSWFSPEGGKKERKKVLDIPMLDHNYLVMLPTNIKIKKVRKEGNDL